MKLENVFNLNYKAFLVIVLVIIAFYFWGATKGYNKFDFEKDHEDFSLRSTDIHHGSYQKLAKGFLKGHLYLSENPHPELLKLENPYDATLNEPYRLHDASLYKDKYYLYFGPVPALIFYLPYTLFTGKGAPDNFFIFLCSVGTVIFSMLLLLFIRNNYFPKAKNWMIILAILVVGFGNISPHLMRLASMYSANISCASFLLLGGIFFFCCAFSETKRTSLMLFWGSLLTVLAIGTRIHYICVLPIIIPLIIWKVNRLKKDKIFRTNAIKALVIPIIIGTISYMTYNYLRFEDIFEVGRRYQLVHTRHRDVRASHKLINLTPSRIPAGAYLALLYPPKINSTFPFVHLHTDVPMQFKLLYPKHDIVIEETVGIVFAVPFILLFVLCSAIFIFLQAPMYNDILKNLKENNFPFHEFLLITIPVVMFLPILFLLHGVAFRYHGDYATFLILDTCIIWFFFNNVFASKILLRKVMNTLAIFLACLSIYFGFAFYIDQRNDHFYIVNPKLYEKIEAKATPISQGIELVERTFSSSEKINPIETNNKHFKPLFPEKGQLLIKDDGNTIFWFDGKDWIVIRDLLNQYKSINYILKATFNPTPGQIEPLLSLGITGEADIFYVKYLDDKHAVFGIDHWGHPPIESNTYKIDKEKTYTIEINCSSEIKAPTFVSLDNEVIVSSNIECYPTDSFDIKVGLNDKGGTICGKAFSGKILKSERTGLFK